MTRAELARQYDIERAALNRPETTGHFHWHADSDHPEILINIWIAAGVSPTAQNPINTV